MGTPHPWIKETASETADHAAPMAYVFSAEGAQAAFERGLQVVRQQIAEQFGHSQPANILPDRHPRLGDCHSLKWPQLLSFVEQEQSIALWLHVHPDTHWFKGHFPQQPILPGVVQTHWACELGRRLFDIDQPFSDLQNLKFQRPVLPDTVLHLELTFSVDDQRLRFCYRQPQQVSSQGRVNFRGASS